VRVGIVGGGQLGQMLAQAGIELGHSFKFLAPPGECCVEGLGDVLRGDFSDAALLADFAKGVDVFTFEWENVPLETLQALACFAPVRPSPQCAAMAKDRILEKRLFQRSGFRVQPFAAIDDAAELPAALGVVGMPAMLKTRGQGYDGKGQRAIVNPIEAPAAFDHLGQVPCILEAFVSFECEISLIAARGRTHPTQPASTLFYAACRNQHVGGILRATTVPAHGVASGLIDHARAVMRTMLDSMDYEGVACVEFFVTSDERGQALVANEMAPRVHNSGHWSIEGAVTSQFANHIRAITRQPLGSTELRGECIMFNIVGELPPRGKMGADVHLHLYGKTPRAGRKLGHLTAVGDDARQRAEGALGI
jgi:5-(carboxyamino)imidazole ribonucleotide synthase